MRSSIVTAGVAVVLFGAMGGQALATSVCYEVDELVSYRLDVRRHSVLTTFRERLKFDNPAQTTYSIQGMATTELGRSWTVAGTATVAPGIGARMSFTGPALFNGASIQVLDCMSEESSPTPKTWDCQILEIRPDDVVAPGPATLVGVDPLDNELCSAFLLPDSTDATAAPTE